MKTKFADRTLSRPEMLSRARCFEQTFTTTPAGPSDTSGATIEFGRHRQVFQLYGIKRGLLHLLCSEGKIRSVVIRRRGNIHGTRYYLMSSVRDYMHSLLAAQEKKSAE